MAVTLLLSAGLQLVCFCRRHAERELQNREAAREGPIPELLQPQLDLQVPSGPNSNFLGAAPPPDVGGAKQLDPII